jgi:hypothetical protein
MKFQVYPCDDGRYFIVDTVQDTVVCYSSNSDLATLVADAMNEINLEDTDCANDDYFDLTKIH